jgi:hypothetical protein
MRDLARVNLKRGTAQKTSAVHLVGLLYGRHALGAEANADANAGQISFQLFDDLHQVEEEY